MLSAFGELNWRASQPPIHAPIRLSPCSNLYTPNSNLHRDPPENTYMDYPNSIVAEASNTEHAPYTPLQGQPSTVGPPTKLRPPLKVFSVTFASFIFLLSLVTLIINQSREPLQTPNKNPSPSTPKATSFAKREPRGVAEGVSAKSNPSFFSDGVSYNWTNAMLAWQRTAYHFQPHRNWMNGPLFYMGWYHLFYQYNPDSAVWGNITWGHAVSVDLIHWFYLPFAMVPDQWYDTNGVWTGSATLLPDGQIMMLYTGDTNDSVQVQNLAYPANLSDPLLIDWIKYPGNPVLVPQQELKPTNLGTRQQGGLDPMESGGSLSGQELMKPLAFHLCIKPPTSQPTSC
ncbi:hypothetical protein GH714_040331 [Hevea brasiliensis]|uniref:beta-fructofuranosidase n=1 Tax=Hevea brasiliensis TaxID=3981 RepID=A0A6A6MUE8_HEVBR|nr:hypothetical protein GH714_040331 [Hevea brasiliensis]